MEILDFLGKAKTLEQGIISVLVFSMLYLTKVLYTSIKTDTKQIDLEHALVGLANTSLEESKLLRQAFESNVTAIKDVSAVLCSMKTSFGDVVKELKNVVTLSEETNNKVKDSSPLLEEIKNNLIKTSITKVVVKNTRDQVVARFTAHPENDEIVVKVESLGNEE